jgi:hypothetical protein
MTPATDRVCLADAVLGCRPLEPAPCPHEARTDVGLAAGRPVEGGVTVNFVGRRMTEPRRRPRGRELARPHLHPRHVNPAVGEDDGGGATGAMWPELGRRDDAVPRQCQCVSDPMTPYPQNADRYPHEQPEKRDDDQDAADHLLAVDQHGVPNPCGEKNRSGRDEQQNLAQRLSRQRSSSLSCGWAIRVREGSYFRRPRHVALSYPLRGCGTAPPAARQDVCPAVLPAVTSLRGREHA